MHKLLLSNTLIICLKLTKYDHGFEYASIYMNMSNCQDSEYAWICIIYPNVPRHAEVLNMVESA